MSKSNPFLVSAEWLKDNLGRSDVKVVDASWYLPAMQRDGKSEFSKAHIPGAVFFDIDAFSDPASSLPHTLSSPEQFSEMAGQLGISESDTIVVYDGVGLFSAARAWWNFRIMGAAKVRLLDGGFPAWRDADYPVESGDVAPAPAKFRTNLRAEAVTSFDDMQTAVQNASHAIADARPHGRFTGEEAEPRPGMRSGHMPGARSLPVSSLVKDGRLLPSDVLEEVIAQAGIDKNAQIITTCGSGVTAAIITLALETVGANQHSLYDGSWSEWGGRGDTAIETGD